MVQNFAPIFIFKKYVTSYAMASGAPFRFYYISVIARAFPIRNQYWSLYETRFRFNGVIKEHFCKILGGVNPVLLNNCSINRF